MSLGGSCLFNVAVDSLLNMNTTQIEKVAALNDFQNIKSMIIFSWIFLLKKTFLFAVSLRHALAFFALTFSCFRSLPVF